ncbi:translation initiation factor IF-2 [Candidatus Woesearchaeota archaeon]|jgi:translation initiation factor 5B|nr:translation initiation factor IF-2 [Candidatus Woesearchaeota archaeon]MBT6023540.1 translation initiation factor IF-2 [Candidatus Woesearchaeota archaeon]
MTIRQPIITVLGHVDHGKTSVLDYLRGTTLADREAGKITQHIGATEVPLDKIKESCGELLDLFKLEFNIPGLLFIDTPGHEAFSNLRKRGGSIADIAVLVIDINQGIQPQTRESIEILKSFKVPFIIAANKVDLITGWNSKDKIFIKNLKNQAENVTKYFNNNFYKILGNLSEMGFESNLYHQVEDHQKTVSIVPVSAKTGEGIPELLAVLTGLSQRFLTGKLEIETDAPAKGTILEIKEEKGMGTTADIIIYEGTLKQDDTIVIGGLDSAVTTKVKALLKTKPLAEIRDKKSSFDKVKEVVAASGVKIIANDLNQAIAGAPLISVQDKSKLEEAQNKVKEEIEEVLVETGDEGVVLKADTLGSLEAASKLFQKHGIPMKRADIGNITKRDIVEAEGSLENGSEYPFVLGFNVTIEQELETRAKKKKIPIIINQVIYKIVEDFEKLHTERRQRLELEEISDLQWPAKIRIMPQYIFRQSGPAIFGAEVLDGKLTPNVEVINKDGKVVGRVKTIEDKGKKLTELIKGKEAALSVEKLTLGRGADGGDFLITNMSESAFRKLKNKKHLLSKSEVEVLKELAEIKRKENDLWGI